MAKIHCQSPVVKVELHANMGGNSTFSRRTQRPEKSQRCKVSPLEDKEQATQGLQLHCSTSNRQHVFCCCACRVPAWRLWFENGKPLLAQDSAIFPHGQSHLGVRFIQWTSAPVQQTIYSREQQTTNNNTNNQQPTQTSSKHPRTSPGARACAFRSAPHRVVVALRLVGVQHLARASLQKPRLFLFAFGDSLKWRAGFLRPGGGPGKGGGSL